MENEFSKGMPEGGTEVVIGEKKEDTGIPIKTKQGPTINCATVKGSSHCSDKG